MLSVKNISFSYGSFLAVDAISFDVKAGEVLGLLGESGSSKSTLLKLIYGVLDVDSGLISWKNQEILGPKNKLIAGPEFMKYVSQEFDLMPFKSVAENIGSNLSRIYPVEKKRRIDELLGVVGLSKFTTVGVKFLSEGQKQRVALAKALAGDPEIILLDEPFAGVDPIAIDDIRSLVSQLKTRNLGILITDHNVRETLNIVDKVYIVNEGAIFYAGDPVEAVNDERIKKFYLGSNFKL